MGGAESRLSPVFPKRKEAQVPRVVDQRGLQYIKIVATVSTDPPLSFDEKRHRPVPLNCKVIFGQKTPVRGEDGRFFIKPLWTRAFRQANVFSSGLDNFALEGTLKRANAIGFEVFIHAHESHEGLTTGSFEVNIYREFARQFWELFIPMCMDDEAFRTLHGEWDATIIELEAPVEVCAVAYELLKLRQNGDSPATAAGLVEIRHAEVNVLFFEVILSEDGDCKIRASNDRPSSGPPPIPPPIPLPPRRSSSPAILPPIIPPSSD